MRLLVGYDGSAGGHDALELARVLCATTGAEALLVTVLPYAPMPVRYALLGEEEARETEPLFAEAREALDGIKVETRTYGGGSPAGVLNDLAEAEKVEMAVVGSPHRGAIGRAVIGSVAEGLLHGAPCAVLAAPRGYAEERHEPFRTIAVAYDGTPEAKAALLRAEGLAQATNGTIRLLTVAEPPVAVPGVAGYTPPVPPDPEEIVREGVKSVDRRLAAEGRHLSGPAAAVIAEACEEDVDLLVTGSRRYGPVARVLLGSVSTKLIHTAPCPVLVVPRP
ncbi:MAG TPA: universal stress protein [Solirubrobacterales bacterium]